MILTHKHVISFIRRESKLQRDLGIDFQFEYATKSHVLRIACKFDVEYRYSYIHGAYYTDHFHFFILNLRYVLMAEELKPLAEKIVNDHARDDQSMAR